MLLLSYLTRDWAVYGFRKRRCCEFRAEICSRLRESDSGRLWNVSETPLKVTCSFLFDKFWHIPSRVVAELFLYQRAARKYSYSFPRSARILGRSYFFSSGNILPSLAEHSSLLTLSQPWPLQEFCPAQAFLAVAQKLCPLQLLIPRHRTEAGLTLLSARATTTPLMNKIAAAAATERDFGNIVWTFVSNWRWSLDA